MHFPLHAKQVLYNENVPETERKRERERQTDRQTERDDYATLPAT